MELIVEHITTGPMIRVPDGTSEEHRIIDARDPNEPGNLALWILSL